MVLKTTLCRFSGLRIWPGRGMLFIRTDNQQYLFLSKKCKSLYHNRLRPAKLAWTTTYRWVGRLRVQGGGGVQGALAAQAQGRGSASSSNREDRSMSWLYVYWQQQLDFMQAGSSST